MGDDQFYKNLRPFSDFAAFSDIENYSRVPDDWSVYVADIAGSTEQIENGNYRQVNTIGAAAITVCLRKLEGKDIPYVFGGDGASLVAPPSMTEIVTRELTGLSQLAKARFGLNLRVGSIKVSELEKMNRFVEVGKFELTKGREVAVFSGGGLALADRLIKENYETYKLAASERSIEEIEGLSCRWNPIPAKRGKIISLIISATDSSDFAIYKIAHKGIEKALSGSIAQANPLNLEKMSYKPMWASIKDESRFHESLLSFSFAKRALEIILATLIFKWNMPALIFDKEEYSNSMITHSDSLKFDDNLRLVLDCSKEEIVQIKLFLESLRKEGKISYGIHESDQALMTCYVEDLNQGNHLHFVDGGDGGYASAAKMLKAQIKALTP